MNASEIVWMTVRQAAERAACSEQTIRRACHRGELRAGRVGVEIRVRVEDVDAWIESDHVTGPIPARDGRRGRKPSGRDRTRTNEGE